MNISIGNDHAGTEYKFAIIQYLQTKGYIVKNYGTNTNNSVDYPDFVHPVAIDVGTSKADFGILICGSANGVAMTANKHKKIRAGVCWTKEITILTREHNNANIICIPARYSSLQQVLQMVDVFLNTDFQGGRHQNRIDKISNIS